MPKLARLILVPVLLATPFVQAACAGPGLTLDRGLALYQDGRYQAAEAAFDELVRLQPDNAAAWNNRGLARLRQGQLMGALGDLTKAMELSPTDPELAFNRGNVYMALGNYDYAIQDYNRAVAFQPSYARAYFNRGTAQLRRGDLSGGTADWQYAAVLETDPTVRDAMIVSAGLVPGGAGPSVASFTGAAPWTAALTVGPTPVARPDTTTVVVREPAPLEITPSALPRFSDAPRTMPLENPTELTLRAVSRELAGDRAGALGDLREAVQRERDPERRAAMSRLLRSLEVAQ